MPGKHLIDTLIFIFCATSEKTFSFFSVFGVRMGARPLSKISGSAPGKKERKKQPGREGEREGRQGEREGRQAGGSEGGQAGRQGKREGRQGESEGRQAGRGRWRACRSDPVLLNTFHLVLTYSTREWDTTLL